MDQIERWKSCGEKPAEYVLDDRHMCLECYKREEKKAGTEQPITSLAA